MNHAITVGEVLGAVLAVGAVVGILGIAFLLIYFLNPFRSGH